MVPYFHDHSQNLSGIAAPLLQLYKKGAAYTWTAASQAGLDIVKTDLPACVMQTKPHPSKALSKCQVTLSVLGTFAFCNQMPGGC